MRMIDEELKELVTDRYFQRGKGYFTNRMLELVAVEKNKVKAYVLGTALYTTHLQRKNGRLEGTCNCQAFFDYGPCKHIAAVGMAVIAHYRSRYQPSDEYRDFKEMKDELESALQRLTKEQLVEFVIFLGSQDQEIMRDLIEKLPPTAF